MARAMGPLPTYSEKPTTNAPHLEHPLYSAACHNSSTITRGSLWQIGQAGKQEFSNSKMSRQRKDRSSICTWLCPMTQQFHSLVPTLEYVLHMCPERPGPICLKKHCLYYQKLETNQKHSLKEDWRKKLWYIYMNEKERTTAMHTSVEEADRSHLEQ